MELATPATRALTDPLGAWAQKRIRLDGVPFSFEGHEYLRAIYDDTAPHIVLSKAAQIGGTTWGILRSLHACLQGLNVIYYFPTRTDVLDFSRSRVGPLLADNPFLAQRMTDTDTVGLKRIGDAHLYFRGMKSTVGMKSVPADMIVFDELDEASPDARALAWERIAHSDYKRIIELSNPSLSGYGIDEQYEKSDQRKRSACGVMDRGGDLCLTGGGSGRSVPSIAGE
jgi:phage terminase large subunit GpA-like protein